MNTQYAIIVAGGIGTRMNNSVPKQFFLIRGKPILMRTLEVFHNTDGTIQIILVLPKTYFPLWEELVQKHSFQVPHRLVEGGNTRFQSVKNGLEPIPNESITAVHDGVRPFVSPAVILHSFEQAKLHGNAIPCIEMKESIRKIEHHSSISLNRKEYKIIQTPQVFQTHLLKKAYSQKENDTLTDDSSVFETLNFPINLIDGNTENIKITHPIDSTIAQAIYNHLSPQNTNMQNNTTLDDFQKIIDKCKNIFINKNKDYGTSWRILRLPSLTDQIYIKAMRIRSIQEKKNKKVDEDITFDFMGIVNYSLMALFLIYREENTDADFSFENGPTLYDICIQEIITLLANKNHDYDEAWKEMRISSMTDIILMKLLRIKQIEDNDGMTLVSENVKSIYQDMINYAVFCLIRLSK
ncbi:MAG: 2-C-methyl-D-erythritol 4-phosphate cytidylyltransferase [Chitinophagaceae bacterium]|nr:2-C-methyl-D-erythritol 4-phosphate cytidylyltransferase [Chitinophagaceae bacterium]